VKLCLDVSSFKFSKKCFYIFTINTCRSTETVSRRFSQTPGLMMFPQGSEPHITSTLFITQHWYNYTIFFVIPKGRFQSFLHCEIIMYFAAYLEYSTNSVSCMAMKIFLKLFFVANYIFYGLSYGFWISLLFFFFLSFLIPDLLSCILLEMK
jgi:hypothetical protein